MGHGPVSWARLATGTGRKGGCTRSGLNSILETWDPSQDRQTTHGMSAPTRSDSWAERAAPEGTSCSRVPGPTAVSTRRGNEGLARGA